MSVCAIGGTINVKETSWWDDFKALAAETWDDITGTAEDTAESAPAPAAASACFGSFTGATAPDEQDAQVEEDGADADIDGADADGDDGDIPEDTPDIPDGEDGDAPNVCNHAPTSPALEYPTPDLIGVSVQPVLNSSDSTDADSVIGDTLSYRFRIFSDSTCTTAIREWTEAVSEHVVAPGDALNFDTDYWFNTEAIDTCPTSVISTPNCSHFHTALPGVCNNEPGVFDLSSPADGVTGQPVLPTFGWGGSDPVDAGDSISYTLIISLNSDCSSPVRSIPVPGVGTTSHTLLPGQELLEGEHYYWMVIATDSCGRTRGSTSIRSFTTQAGCTPATPIIETDFTSGTPTSLVVNLGSVSLSEDNAAWTNCYDGSVFPETVGWTEFAPTLGWIVKSAPSGILELNDIDRDDNGYFQRSVPFIDSTGWLVEARTLLVDSQGETGCGIRIRDDVNTIEFLIANTRILENNSSRSYTMDPRSSYGTYRIAKNSGVFTIYVDGVSRINGSAGGGSGTGSISFHDFYGTNDGHAFWDYLCYYTGGSLLPYVSSGNYISSVVDLGPAPNNIGSGATISFNATIPALTGVVFETRSGNTSAPDVSWTSWVSLGSGNTIQSPSARYIQVRPTLTTTNTLITPQLDDYTIEYCTY